MGYKVYRVERQTTNGFWYEVMLSPFLTVRDAGRYIKKYKNSYPLAEQIYRVIDDQIDGKVYRRLKSFFSRKPDPLKFSSRNS